MVRKGIMWCLFHETQSMLLLFSSPDHVYEWCTVPDFFQTEATPCTKYVILFYYTLSAVSVRLCGKLWVVMWIGHRCCKWHVQRTVHGRVQSGFGCKCSINNNNYNSWGDGSLFFFPERILILIVILHKLNSQM